jgi:hypothetical protein
MSAWTANLGSEPKLNCPHNLGCGENDEVSTILERTVAQIIACSIRGLYPGFGGRQP